MNPQPKIKTDKDPKYLAWVRKQPCVITGRSPCEAHHTETGGIGMKGSDYSAVPLHWRQHRICHAVGEKTFWYTADPVRIIRNLLERYEDEKEHR